MRKIRFKRIAKILLALFLVTFVSLEVYFRMMDKTEYGYIAPVMRVDETLGFKFIPGGEYGSGEEIVRFNKYGYVGPDWTVEKEPGTFRIAVVGTCIMSGVFHIIDTALYNYPELAELELRKEGYNVEILNFGVPGESRSYYNLRTIEEDVRKFKPDVVILENLMPYTKKDYARDEYQGYQLEYLFTSEKSKQEAKDWADKLNKWKAAVFLIDNSWVIKKLALKYQHTHHDDLAAFIQFAVKNQVSFIDDAVTGIYTMDKSIEMTEELAASLKQDSIDFKMLYYQTKPNSQEDAEAHMSSNIGHIFLKTRFKQSMFYPKDNHFNNLGQLHITDKFIEEIRQIIPAEYQSLKVH